MLIPSLLVALCLLLCPAARGQQTASNQNDKGAAAEAAANNRAESAAPSPASPAFADYKGVRIGMSADDVRAKLDHLKEKSKDADFFAFSEAETAQVYYDAQGKVAAVSVVYSGDDAPKPEAVLGEALEAKPDGSMYALKRYPAAGYWVAYSRTAGKNPIVTVTMQKMQ
ncbi:MAG: hypothetical protein M3268_02470 [Acidobacteriota bacterium]|nr:hypothetical protein [Acidobacteriota bacterium]